MNDIVLTIISTVITAVVLPLITLAGNKLIAWIGTKTKNEKAAAYLQRATSIIFDAVRSVTQTYVDSLKKSGTFDAAAQAEALRRCKTIITTQLTDDVKEYITAAYGDFETWVNTQIEASINALKKAK